MQQGKIALITGANKGIGLETARQLGGLGCVVLVGARDAERREEAVQKLRDEGLDAHSVELDVASTDSIRRAAAQVEAQFGHLDILVNNAGVNCQYVSPSQSDMGDVRRVFDINFFAVVEATNIFLPLLQKSAAPRIVNVSSGLGSLTQNADPNWEFAAVNLLAYNASKSALNMFTVTLAKELRDTPFKVNSADPGYTATDLNNNTGPRTVAQAATVIVRLATLNTDGETGGYFDENGTIPW